LLAKVSFSTKSFTNFIKGEHMLTWNEVLLYLKSKQANDEVKANLKANETLQAELAKENAAKKIYDSTKKIVVANGFTKGIPEIHKALTSLFNITFKRVPVNAYSYVTVSIDPIWKAIEDAVQKNSPNAKEVIKLLGKVA